jgi:hypothetical protein
VDFRRSPKTPPVLYTKGVFMDEKLLEELAQRAYESYAGMENASPDDYYVRDILPYNQLSSHSKKHWRDVARSVVLASWNLDYPSQI